MSGNLPFGFHPPGEEGPNNPLGGFDLNNIGAMLESLGRMMQSGATSGPVNWEMAKQIARQDDAQKSDPGVTSAERSAVEDSVRLANHWLDGACGFSASNAAAIAWTRGEWVDNTLPAWQRIVGPVAEHVQGTMSGLMGGTGLMGGQGLPGGIPGMESEDMQQLLGPLAGLTRQLGSALFATQAGQGLGSLSGEVLCSSDIGIPLTPDGRPSILPANVNVFADGLGLQRQEVLLFVALRECAHQRLFTHVPWLRSRLEEAIDAYARGIHVDTSAIEDLMGRVDPTDPSSMGKISDAMNEGFFSPKDSPEQEAALARLETLLALIEGWVDAVVVQAVGDRVPALPQLTEAMRRRRAAGGPAEKTFANLVGLEMRPRRLREAAEFWRTTGEGQIAARDSSWEHPDLLPTAEDLDDLPSFFARSQWSTELLPVEDDSPKDPPANNGDVPDDATQPGESDPDSRPHN